MKAKMETQSSDKMITTQPLAIHDEEDSLFLFIDHPP